MRQRHLQNSGKCTDMKRYTVKITDEALTDMDGIYHYIAYDLLAMKNTIGWIVWSMV